MPGDFVHSITGAVVVVVALVMMNIDELRGKKKPPAEGEGDSKAVVS
jgi:hypothetical protein